MDLEKAFQRWVRNKYPSASPKAIQALRQAFYAGSKMKKISDDDFAFDPKTPAFLRRQAEGTDMSLLQQLIENMSLHEIK